MLDLKIEIRWNHALTDSPALKFRTLLGGERSNVVPNRAEIVWELGRQGRGVSASFRQYLQEFLKANPEADAFPVRTGTEPESGKKLLHVTFIGKSAHSSTPYEGHNALLDSLLYFSQLPEQPDPLVKTARFLYDKFRDLDGNEVGIAGRHHFLGRTTLSLDILEMDGESAMAVVNIRPTIGLSPNDILETVRAQVLEWAQANGLEATVEFRGKVYEPLYVNPRRHFELIHALQVAYQRVTGREPELRATAGTTYAKAFPNAVSFGPILPEEEEARYHQADECVKIEHLLRNTRIYASALLMLAADLNG
ncbi:M20/M25/M40 family metallo-hydrolase [bacterium]|nr:M20/M25/M40 family metallo-hydrolase [bacterium]